MGLIFQLSVELFKMSCFNNMNLCFNESQHGYLACHEQPRLSSDVHVDE